LIHLIQIYWKISFFYFKFLQNTPGVGAEYEVVAAAYFALKLNNSKDIQDYSIESNLKNFGKFDDVIINVSTRNNQQIRVAIQLKYNYNTKNKIDSGFFEKLNGDFSLNKYYEAFKTMSDENKQCQFILYTNAQTNFKKITKTSEFTIIEDHCNEQDIAMLIDTSSGGGNIYRFEDNNINLNDKEVNSKKSDYEDFLSRFRIFVCQKNVRNLRADIIRILEENASIKYMDLFRKWHQGNFTNKKIDKAMVNVYLIDMFLSPFILPDRYFPVGQNEKLKLFEKAITEFDVTLVNDSFKHFTKNLTDDFNPEEGIEEKLKSYKKNYKMEPNASADECIIRLAKEMKIIDKYATVLEYEVRLKVLQYAFEKPIIVKFNETSEESIYKIMELHQLGSKIKFILVGQGIQSAKLSRFRIFENVNDLRSNDELYREVTRTCRLSLQGRKETTLEELIDSCKEICEHFGVKEVIQMLKETFLIGQAIMRLPSFYVHRKVFFKIEKIDAIFDGTFFYKHLAVVKFDRKTKKIHNDIRKCNINVVDVHDYLKSAQVSKEPTIISTNEECSKQILEDVLKKSDNKTVVYLRISEDNGFLVISIDENQLHCLTRSVNILCADPGMGKTTLLKKLRNECDSRFWTIDVDLKTHNEFFKTKHDADELLNHLFEGNENNFSKHIRNVFQCNKKVYFFFDGLDEVEKSCVGNVLDCVKKLSSEGFHIWISSRKNLKTKLEERFNKVAMMDMEEIEEAHQKFYIRNRLKEECNHEQIENLISKIFNNSDIDNNRQILGKVLQLYIITQNFLDNKEQHQMITEDTSTFVFTKMYEWFFRGRFKHNRDKEEARKRYLSWVEEEDILEIYEHLAVHSVFGEEVLKKLKLDLRRSRRFLNQIKTNKDPLGIVTKVNDEGKAVFEHFTYGEYFAARFLASNFEKARLIREELFSDGRKNLMMILSVILAEDNPLHLAVIYRNVDQIEKYIDDKNVYDKAGRNPLHLATYMEPRFVDPRSCFIEVSIKAIEYLTNITILKHMVKFNYADCDKLFNWNALEYAFGNKSFISVEMILKICEYSKEELRQYINEYINNDKFVLFCLTHGCRKLLSFILENSDKITNYFQISPYAIIQHTIKNCYFQENKTLRFVMDTLEHKYDFVMDSTNERGETALHLAAKYGRNYAVQVLLEKGASVNVVTEDYKTPLDLALANRNEQIVNLLTENTSKHPLSLTTSEYLTEKRTFSDNLQNNSEFQLHIAAYRGNLERGKLLIDEGEIVDAITNIRETPLHIAACEGNVDTAELLIEKGAAVNALSNYKLTPLHHAALSGNYETVALLIEKGGAVNACAIDNETPLHCGALSRSLTTVALLIQKGASVNALASNGTTPLHLASESGNFEIVALLIEKGAYVNALAKNELTPLHMTAKTGNLKTTELLIEKGAAVNALSNYKLTPLHHAALSGNYETVALLIEKGGAVNACAIDNETPLHCGALSRSLTTVALLIQKGASVNALASNGTTPLHLASESGNFEIVALLIEKGAYVNALANNELTPLHMTAKTGNLKTTELLIEKGAAVNALSNYKLTPLHHAALSGNYETVALLIEKGGAVNACAIDNETPLHCGAISRSLTTVALLIQKGASVNALSSNGTTPLHLASESGNSETVALLIEKGARVDALAKNELTPLHMTAKTGNLKTTELLIEKGASVNALASNYTTPLHLASESGNSKTAELLIEKGASVNAVGIGDETPLHMTAKTGNLKTTELLIEKGAAVNALSNYKLTPLHHAALSGNYETVVLLIEKGGAVNACAIDNETPLHCGALSRSLTTVALLIQKGASVNALASNGTTPLHLASESGNFEIVALLIEKGAYVNALAKNELTPLHMTAKTGNLKTTELLIEKGAAVNALSNYKLTPLHHAALSGNYETVALLIEKGGAVNACAIDNETPLHCGAISRSLTTVALLIQKGASVNALSSNGTTPLHWASESGNSETVALLIEKGARVDALAKNELTPLHMTAKTGNLKTTELLIEKGACVNALTDDDITPLHLASKSGNTEIVALLIEKGASVNALAKNKLTPLHMSAKTGNSKTAELLIEKGASVNAQSRGNETPLHEAALSGNSKTAKILIEKGAFVNALTNGNLSPLQCAIQSGNSETIALLTMKESSVG
jgi:ankyrin repeat protein